MEIAEAKIVSLPTLKVAGLAHTGEGEFSETWDNLIPRMAEFKHRAANGWSYGVIATDPANASMKYLAGFGVDSIDDLPSGMTVWDVPANQYAVFPATLNTIPDTFDHIFREWLPGSGYVPGEGPSLEVYDENFNGGDSTLYIYVPIKEPT